MIQTKLTITTNNLQSAEISHIKRTEIEETNMFIAITLIPCSAHVIQSEW